MQGLIQSKVFYSIGITYEHGGGAGPLGPPGSVLLVSLSDASGYSLLWHVTSGQVLSKQREDRQTLASAVAPGCETFCTTGSDGCLFIYDTETHTKLRTLEPR